jgi:hypothetical protein
VFHARIGRHYDDTRERVGRVAADGRKAVLKARAMKGVAPSAAILTITAAAAGIDANIPMRCGDSESAHRQKPRKTSRRASNSHRSSTVNRALSLAGSVQEWFGRSCERRLDFTDQIELQDVGGDCSRTPKNPKLSELRRFSPMMNE